MNQRKAIGAGGFALSLLFLPAARAGPETDAYSALIPSSVAALHEKSRLSPGGETSETRRMIRHASLHGYRSAMEELLSSPAWNFTRVISPAAGRVRRSIYMEMSRLAAPLNNAQRAEIPEFYREALDLLIAVTPPLMKKNKDGMTARGLADARNNQPALEVFARHKRIRSAFELDTGDQDSIWSQNISLAPLEKTPLARAAMAEDPEAFWKALEDLFSGPAKDLLSALHSRTSGGDSLFHLLAKAPSHREEFAAGMNALITFIAPSVFYFSKPAGGNLGELLLLRAAAASLMLGLPVSAVFFLTGSPEAGWPLAALSGAGIASGCYAAVTNKASDSVIKSLPLSSFSQL